MRAQKSKELVAASSGIVVGASKHGPRRYGLHLKLVGLVAAVVVSVTAVIFGLVAFIHRPASKNASSSNQTTSQNNQASTIKSPFNSTYDKAFMLSQAGKYDAAQQLLSNQLKTATSNADKSDIYSNKATIAFNAAQYSQGLQYGQTAEALSPTAASADIIAMNAEKLNETSLALKYYQAFLLRKGKPTTPTSNDWIKAKITALGG